MDELKKLLGHHNAPSYLILLLLSVWFVAWIALAPGGKKKYDRGYRPKHDISRAVAALGEGEASDNSFAEKPAKPAKPRDRRGRGRERGDE